MNYDDVDYCPTLRERMRDYWRGHLRIEFRRQLALFVLIFAASAMVFSANHELAEDIFFMSKRLPYSFLRYVYAEESRDASMFTKDAMPSKSGLVAEPEPTAEPAAAAEPGAAAESGAEDRESRINEMLAEAMSIEFRNNLMRCLLCVALGFAPFLFLPALVPYTYAVWLAASLGVKGFPFHEVVRTAVSGVFSIPALLLCGALCRCLSRNIRGRETVSPMSAIGQTLVYFIVIALPLTAIGAAVNAYAADEVAAWLWRLR